MEKISTFLWFDNQAEEAVNFYTSLFKNSKKGLMSRYSEAGPGPAGSVMTATFELEGRPFIALNGGPHFKFTEAISLVINCESQQEVDYYWDGLLGGGGTPSQCGWLKDKYGLSWQVVPTILLKFLADKDRDRAKRVTQAMMKMVKIEIKALEDAYNAEPVEQ
jgi:predicted 3-demethylubiquinone-9 3-methyltransferase (glyoxalase superfamily)